MMKFKGRSLILAASLVLAAGVTGCTSATKSEVPTSNAKMSVSAALVIADIQSIKVTISDNGAAPAFTAIDLLLSKAPAGNVWTGNISQIPASGGAGSGRRFNAQAWSGPNGTGTVLYEGDTVATLIGGAAAPAEVTIILQEKGVLPGPTNYAPVITALTSTAAYVLPGQSGSSTVTATDLDNPSDPLAFLWTASCLPASASLVFDTGTATTATARWTAPSVSSVCTIAVKVTETTTTPALSVTTYFTVTVNADYGNANIAAFPNSFPIVTVRGDFRYNFFSDVAGMPVGQQGDLFFHALDPDGDNVRFDLSLRCKDDTAVPAVPWSNLATTFFSASTFTTTATGTVAPPLASNFDFNPTFGYPSPALPVTNPYLDCEFKITVQDLCTAGNCGAAGAQGTLPNGADKVTTIGATTVKSFTTGLINATHPSKAKRAPVIVRTIAPNQLGGDAVNVNTWDPAKKAQVAPSTAYVLQAEADDRFEGGTLLPTWTCVNGTVVSPGPINTGNLKTSAVWTSPASLTVGMQCTVSFQSTGLTGSGLSTVATFQFVSSNPCVGKANGTACDDGNACTTGETCQAEVCTATPANTVTCSALDQCHEAGVCNTATGICSNPFKAAGQACTDGNACTSGDVCNGSGACTPGTGAVCVALDQCHAAGVCDTATGVCSNPFANAGTPCNDGNLCNSGDTCNGSGTCQAGPTVVSCAVGECVSVAGICNPASGACEGGVNQPNGTACTSDGNACTTDACQGGICAHSAVTCAAAQRPTCDPATGCQDTTVVNTSMASLDLARVDGLGLGTATSTSLAGTTYLSGTRVFSPAVTVSGASITGAGGNDVYLAKHNLTTGALIWSKAFGDDKDQFGQDSTGETADGTVAVIGTMADAAKLGECVAGPPVSCTGNVITNGTGQAADFLMLVDGATGAMKAGGLAISNGLSGKLSKVAANPALNLIAVCGSVNGASSSLCALPGATCNAYQNGTDLIVAVFNTSGVLQWARQVGGPVGPTVTNEDCSAVAIADDGTVWAAGRYRQSLDLGGGSSVFPVLPNTSAVLHMWVGHFGTAGATLAAEAYGTQANHCAGRPQTACTVATAATDCAGATPATCTTAAVGNVVPASLKVDGAGAVVVGGNFTASFPPGNLVSAGVADAFVAKFSSSLSPIWAVRLGNGQPDQTNAVAIAPGNNVVAAGIYAATIAGTPTTGAAALTAPAGNTANQAFLLKLDGATGATHFAGGYGDSAVQSANHLVVRATSGSTSGASVQWAGGYLGTLDLGGGVTLTNSGTTNLGFLTVGAIQ